jgi:hypothetical protein
MGLWDKTINPLNAELNPICHLLELLGAHHILHISRIRVKVLVSNEIMIRKETKFEAVNQSEILRQKHFSVFHIRPSIYGATAPSGPWPPSHDASIPLYSQLFSSAHLVLGLSTGPCGMEVSV